MIRQIIMEILQEESCVPIKLGKPQDVSMSDKDRLDTGDSDNKVWTHDLFSATESPRLGCGVMEMEKTTFPWTLQYDEIDFVLSGQLTIYYENHAVTANPGEVILIPRGSRICFSAPDHARFLYFTHPADWQAGA